jgi:hypothetical protein
MQKPEGFRIKASKGDVVVFLLRTLSNHACGVAGKDLKFSGFPKG